MYYEKINNVTITTTVSFFFQIKFIFIEFLASELNLYNNPNNSMHRVNIL
jgi:hypothetical protein